MVETDRSRPLSVGVLGIQDEIIILRSAFGRSQAHRENFSARGHVPLCSRAASTYYTNSFTRVRSRCTTYFNRTPYVLTFDILCISDGTFFFRVRNNDDNCDNNCRLGLGKKKNYRFRTRSRPSV